MYLCDGWKEGGKAGAYAPAETRRQHIFLLNCFPMQTAGLNGLSLFFVNVYDFQTAEGVSETSVTSLRVKLHLKWWYMKHLKVCFEDFRQTVSALVRWQSHVSDYICISSGWWNTRMKNKNHAVTKRMPIIWHVSRFHLDKFVKFWSKAAIRLLIIKPQRPCTPRKQLPLSMCSLLHFSTNLKHHFSTNLAQNKNVSLGS